MDILIGKYDPVWGISIGKVGEVYSSPVSDYFTLSKTGGIKFNYKGEFSYISKSKFDTYDVVDFKGRNVLVFTKEYDETKAFEILRNCIVVEINERIEQLKSILPLISETGNPNILISF